MQYQGEIISIGVAISWTLTALCFEHAGKRLGTLSLNIIRLGMSILMLGITLFIFTGQVVPLDASGKAWLWLAVSGLVGYLFGDYCLFSSYILIGSRFGQLFMTLAPPSAALAGMVILGERLNGLAWLGMFITLFGIGISIMGKGQEPASRSWRLQLPLKGVLFGIGAGIGQGVGLVFSKLGMDYYLQDIDPLDSTALQMVPFASTQIRAFTGIAGFLLVMLWKHRSRNLFSAFKDKKAMLSVTGGTFFGPFLGVSFSLMAVQYTQAGIASTLMALTPILILLPSHFIFKQKITWKEVAGALVSVAGVSLFFM